MLQILKWVKTYKMKKFLNICSKGYLYFVRCKENGF